MAEARGEDRRRQPHAHESASVGSARCSPESDHLKSFQVPEGRSILVGSQLRITKLLQGSWGCRVVSVTINDQHLDFSASRELGSIWSSRGKSSCCSNAAENWGPILSFCRGLAHLWFQPGCLNGQGYLTHLLKCRIPCSKVRVIM